MDHFNSDPWEIDYTSNAIHCLTFHSLTGPEFGHINVQQVEQCDTAHLFGNMPRNYLIIPVFALNQQSRQCFNSTKEKGRVHKPHSIFPHAHPLVVAYFPTILWHQRIESLSTIVVTSPVLQLATCHCKMSLHFCFHGLGLRRDPNIQSNQPKKNCPYKWKHKRERSQEDHLLQLDL